MIVFPKSRKTETKKLNLSKNVVKIINKLFYLILNQIVALLSR